MTRPWPELIDELNSSEPEIRQQAMKDLLNRDSRIDSAERNELAPRLHELMLSREIADPERQTAAMCLGRIGAEERLIDRLGDDDPTVRGHATTGLGECRTESSVPYLIDRLKDDVNKVRNLAERALIARVELVRQCGIEPLLKLLDHPEPLTHSPAARLLGLSGDERALQPLLKMLAGSEKWLSRVWAAKSLGDLGSAAAVPPLTAALQSDDKNRVRAAAAAALGELKDPAAEAALQQALTDEDAGVQAAARDALDRLSQSADTEPPDPFAPDSPDE